jgi:phosphoribosylanthranilate isomerase
VTFVKICGITNLPDALVSVEAGADMLGFNFYRRSPRYINASDARALINQLPKSVLAVGVFVNELTPRDVLAIADESGIGAIQLHGDEDPEYCKALLPFDVIKAFRSDEHFAAEQVLRYPVRGVMLDAFHRSARGGTGHSADWQIAAQVRELVPEFYLAGGLGPENVQNAVETVRPYAVDACSRLESEPGRKDPSRVFDFVKAAKIIRKT